jgi:hypothetical protein
MPLPTWNFCIRRAAALFNGLLASRVQRMILSATVCTTANAGTMRGLKGMVSNEETLDSAAAGCRRYERMLLGTPWAWAGRRPE